MVNLRAIANGITRSINPNLSVVLRAYSGYTTSAAGHVTASYAAAAPVEAQVQALTKLEIAHLDAMNISNCDRAAYVSVVVKATDRLEQTGGDLLQFEGAWWLVTAILEGWTTAGWMKVALTKQIAGPPV